MEIRIDDQSHVVLAQVVSSLIPSRAKRKKEIKISSQLETLSSILKVHPREPEVLARTSPGNWYRESTRAPLINQPFHGFPGAAPNYSRERQRLIRDSRISDTSWIESNATD